MLLPGDRLFVPERHERTETCASRSTYTFVRKGLRPLFRIRLLGAEDGEEALRPVRREPVLWMGFPVRPGRHREPSPGLQPTEQLGARVDRIGARDARATGGASRADRHAGLRHRARRPPPRLLHSDLGQAGSRDTPLRISGSYLPRYAARTIPAEPYHDPPRTTRSAPLGFPTHARPSSGAPS